ncbi:hypothetical protein H6G27_24185 [Nostoc linckia FACHB-104]|nr:hypothetical protein [Nostoc linckia FACHB-104]
MKNQLFTPRFFSRTFVHVGATATLLVSLYPLSAWAQFGYPRIGAPSSTCYVPSEGAMTIPTSQVLAGLAKYNANPRSDDSYILRNLARQGMDYTVNPYPVLVKLYTILKRGNSVAVRSTPEDAALMALRGYKEFPSSLPQATGGDLLSIFERQLNTQDQEQQFYTDRAQGTLKAPLPDTFLLSGIRRLADHVEQYDNSPYAATLQRVRRESANPHC